LANFYFLIKLQLVIIEDALTSPGGRTQPDKYGCVFSTACPYLSHIVSITAPDSGLARIFYKPLNIYEIIIIQR
jgi:hypothetical protein